MNHGARLLPNFAAEEGARWRDRQDAMRSVANLWGLLFGSQSQLIGEDNVIRWPAALGPRPDEPIFPWLEDSAKLVCWLESEEARSDPLVAGYETAGPPCECVARVHEKAFAHRSALREGLVPRCLRDLVRVLEPAELADPNAAIETLREALDRWPAWARASFTLKPRFGSSGRGRVAGSEGSPDSPEIRGGLPRLAARGGALLEPWLDRTLDLSAQLRVDPAGGTLMLGTLEQLCTPSGVYRGHRGWLDSKGRIFSGSDYDEPLREAAAALAQSAANEGYFGPASLDGFAFRLHEDPQQSAREIFRPAVDLNARFTLGTIALGLVRRTLRRVKKPLGLQPGNRRAFLFALRAPQEGWQDATASAGRLAHLVPLWRDDAAADEPRPALLFAESDRELDATASSIRSQRRSSDVH